MLLPMVGGFVIKAIASYIAAKKTYKKTAYSKEALPMKNRIKKECSLIKASLLSTTADLSIGVAGSLLA
ncbi:hypothetical protein QE450_004189 [Paenibacillus sp. SORGH_AS306]|uniref:hypothetical protein n=1 Tax=unclassified Paenibacillus TaxID=185978 RepID=UPI00278A6B27|nr:MULTISPECIES: hypothetical protein [unclassified Paenibacillus]MDQ1236691.1 hypothetical protein [Paenibacillus sp. SORGH_AS_0306]MDR6109048.1 hypothetical protein [Paenibacillus sp. SORGH_AS_0338]